MASMTLITGTIKDSGGAALSGSLRVTLDASLVDGSTTPDSVLVSETKEFTITSGAISITLAESQSSELTYRFEFLSQTLTTSYYFADGGLYPGPKHFWTDSNWYTGAAHTVSSSLLFEQIETRSKTILDFHAIVPNVASYEFANLLPTGITTDVLDTSLRRVAELLVFTQAYATVLRGGPRWLGDYSAATFYQLDDGVQYAGSSWIYLNPDPASGQTPSLENTTYWMCAALKGNPGGTGGNDVAYDATGWNGATDAPSRNAIRDLVEGFLVKTSQLSSYALLASPTFSGTPLRSANPTAGDRTLQLSTTQWVGNEFAPLNNAALTGNPTSVTPSVDSYSDRLATTKWVVDRTSRLLVIAQRTTTMAIAINTFTTVVWDSELQDPLSAFAPGTGTFTPVEVGWYRFIANFSVEAIPNTVTQFRLIVSLYQGVTEIARLWDVTSAGYTQYVNAYTLLNLTALTGCTIRVFVNGSGVTSAQVSVVSVFKNQLEIQRVIL